MTTIYAGYLRQMCVDITEKLGLDKDNKHIAAVFANNNSQQVIGWAVLDKDNNILEQFDDIKKLFDKYE